LTWQVQSNAFYSLICMIAIATETTSGEIIHTLKNSLNEWNCLAFYDSLVLKTLSVNVHCQACMQREPNYVIPSLFNCNAYILIKSSSCGWPHSFISQ